MIKYVFLPQFFIVTIVFVLFIVAVHVLQRPPGLWKSIPLCPTLRPQLQADLTLNLHTVNLILTVVAGPPKLLRSWSLQPLLAPSITCPTVIMWKVVLQHLFINIIPINFRGWNGTKTLVWLRGWLHRPLLAQSVNISNYNSVESGGSTFIYEHNPQQFHGWNWTKKLVWAGHEGSTKGRFTHKPRAVTMKLWEPKRKCPKAVPTQIQNHVVWSRILKCSVKSYVTGPQPNAFPWISIHIGLHTW
jgi:hypothetical protein